jgi:Flp pilus assembly protein TadG
MTIFTAWLRTRALAEAFLIDGRAIAATEFAVIVPIMLVMFFGTVEMSNGVAVYRKVTLMAHTLSDLTSQSVTVQASDITNFFAASTGIMTPYSTTSLSQTVTELWVNPSLQARVQWSSGASALAAGTVVAIPSQLATANTYVIYSQVSYQYVPVVGYVMAKAGVTLSDVSYTRPRQSTCVLFSPQTTCPTT